MLASAQISSRRCQSEEVARQPADFQSEHHADLAHADGGHQALEADPVGIGSGLAQVRIDDHHLLGLPSESDGPLTQRVLALGRFGVLEYLAQRRLADIEVYLARQVGWR